MAAPKEIRVSGGRLFHGDCVTAMSGLEEDSIDLVIGSPPYEGQRTYGELQFDLLGQDWVDWMVTVVRAALRVCKGLVAFVVEGFTEDYRYSCTPALLMADLHRSGVCLRKPPIYRRNGIMGSGGPDWLSNCWEWIICCTKTRGRLPWSDNTACGHPPKFAPGGKVTHRNKDGSRRTGGASLSTSERNEITRIVQQDGVSKKETASRIGVGMRRRLNSDGKWKKEGAEGGAVVSKGVYVPPERANPGNVIDCRVGGGHIGSNIAHENEAPFPEKIPDFFIRSFCPPGGVVLDPFAGSGTTLAAAIKCNRTFVGVDKRRSQIDLIRRRITQARQEKGFGLA